MPPELKSIGLASLRRLGVLAGLRRANRHRTVVLTYHGVLSQARPGRSYLDYNFPTADLFEQQVVYLKRHYTPIPMAEFVDSRVKQRALPPYTAVVTFDDGFANNGRVAFPILQAHGVPFTVFLTTGMIGRRGAQLWSERVSRAVWLSDRTTATATIAGRRRHFSLQGPGAHERVSRALVAFLKRQRPSVREAAVAEIDDAFGAPPLRDDELERYEFLTWEAIRTLAAAGVEFGSHTVDHPILSTLDDADLRPQLVESKQEIERQLGRSCDTFAYPNGGDGDFGPRDMTALRAAGYRCAFALRGGLAGAENDDFAIPRVNIGRDFTEPHLDAALSGLLYATRRVRNAMQPSRHSSPDPAALELDRVH